MNSEFNFQTNAEILRLAEQQRGEVMAVFFRWLFAERKHTTPEHSVDAVAAE